MDEVCRLLRDTERLEVGEQIVRNIGTENVVEKLIEFDESVRIVRQAKMMFAATAKHPRILDVASCVKQSKNISKCLHIFIAQLYT